MVGSAESPGVADDSLGEADGDSLTDGDGDADADGVGEGDEVGAVGVGTGGFAQRQPLPLPAGSAAFVVRPACRAAPGATSVATVRAGVSAIASAAGGAGVAGATRRRREVPCAGGGPCPTCSFDVTAGGTVPAAAVRSSNSGPRPFTTARYAPAAPATVSRPKPVTAAARRGARGVTGALVRGASKTCPPNVLIPVEVMSGPAADGSAGRRPRS
jgi:hypothetical protein